ncbi:MAG: amino acid adenylation domain-containing protein [Marinagarivorans sp.]|nr:amino acid adenylation domain-containing protein [Marinagarivorans sp.]
MAELDPSRGYLACFESGNYTDKTAVYCGDKRLSYAELRRRAAQFSAVLREQGVASGSTVAVSIDRSENLLPLLLGIWSLRATYVPVDPTFPVERQLYVLEHCKAQLLLVEHTIPANYCGQWLRFEELLTRSDGGADPGPLACADYDDKDLAYIIYTSGSTGLPKGVAVLQSGVMNFLLSMREAPGLTEADVLLAVTTISFDIHVLELFLPLLVGATVVIATKAESSAQASLRQLLDTHAVTCMQATPATWRVILDRQWRPQQKLKMLIGGEAFPMDLLPAMQAAASDIWNMYGPTETTVWSTCYRVPAQAAKMYVGRAIRNTSTYVADEQLCLLPANQPGELLIGGQGLAQGYFNNPLMTAERFVALSSGERVYRTGDLVRMDDSGLIEYLSRADDQIKIRGFRVEPGEIEALLTAQAGIEQCVVVAAAVSAGDLRLVAFYRGEQWQQSALRELCTAGLPAYMVPQHCIHLLEFPHTANLKVDRKSLAATALQHIEAMDKPDVDSARDDLDRSLIAVWEDALGVKGVHIDDNFFDLGGHSLLALELVASMGKATGLEFDLDNLFTHPSIRGCRDSLGDASRRAASVVKLNRAESGEPIFCLCGVMIYSELAATFNDERPVYGIFAQEELQLISSDQKVPVDFSFDLLTDSYVNAILRQGHNEHVTLVGLSFGGLICLEAAKKLEALGVHTKNIFLLDTFVAPAVTAVCAPLCAMWWAA